MIIVDTNVWSEVTKRAPATQVIAWLRDHQAEAALTTITVGELLTGLALMPDGQRRADLTEKVEQMIAGARARTYAYDEPAARAHAAIVAERRSAGRPIAAPEDAMIASIARARRMSVATRNVTDFEGMGIDLINPWD